MKQLLLLSVFLQLAFGALAQYQTGTCEAGQYTNPIFAGDYPDPSILRDGDDYYMVHSSFEYYPGLLIWHSKDLINWTPLTNTLHKYVGSVWAPDLVKYNKKYYIYFPANNTNYVITADRIEGPWSEPVHLDLNFIDPGHVADEKGNRYLYFNSGAYVPLSKDGLAIAGKPVHSYPGWPIPREWSIECFCMEGPKLVKHGQYYYLTVAQGGTAGPPTGHMIVTARSKSPLGPWENAPNNPILRAKSGAERWWSQGHGTLFEGPQGQWYMLFHAYEKGFYGMGRQTLLLPVEWTADGWFKIADDVSLYKPVKLPQAPKQPGSFGLSDAFDGKALRKHWKFFGGYQADRVTLNGKGLTVKAKGSSIADCSPMLCVPSHHAYQVQVEMDIAGDAVGGLVLFYNEKASSGILADAVNVLANLRGWQFATEKEVIDRHVFLKLKNINHQVDMYYSLDGEKWIKIENSLEVSGLHHNVLSGFMSLRVGLCAMGSGAVTFKNFKYHQIIGE